MTQYLVIITAYMTTFKTKTTNNSFMILTLNLQYNLISFHFNDKLRLPQIYKNHLLK